MTHLCSSFENELRGALLLEHYLEARLAEADGLVARVSAHLERQRQLLSRMECAGQDTRRPRQVLVTFEISLRLHAADRDRLQAQLENLSADVSQCPDHISGGSRLFTFRQAPRLPAPSSLSTYFERCPLGPGTR